VAKKTSIKWASWRDERLLGLRFCDLGVKIEGTELEGRIERLWGELERKALIFRPYFWLSTDWFTPDGMDGVAVPFYLAHPRLSLLEKRRMLEVEGGGENACMRILRHEAGHAIDNAYRLHLRKRYRDLFGKWSDPYPRFYRPKPYSRGYVLHLDSWYAQAHPAEDFAETFAVWLRPGSRWRKQYAGWGALRKLEYMDELMEEIAGQKPVVTSREYVKPISRLRTTLGEYYEAKQERYGSRTPDFYDRDLRRLFSDDRSCRRNPTAASFLRANKAELRRVVSHWTGEYQYIIEQVLNGIIERCAELKLRLAHSERTTKTQTLVMVTVQTMNYLHAGNHRVAL
jgi:hypothetical protein